MSERTKCLVTMTIGADYQRMWEAVFARTFRLYAEKHGYDVIVVTDYVDQSPAGRARGPHWQKLVLHRQPDIARYRDVVWIDADIMINHHRAPCIVTANNSDKIGAVTHNTFYNTPERWENRWNRVYRNAGDLFRAERGPTAPERYRQAGLPGDVDDMVNTGVMVLKPALHADFLEWVYANCTENKLSASEQMPLSYHMFRRGLCNPLDPRFNRPWTEELSESYPFLFQEQNHANQALVAYCVNAAWHNSYFLHFLADGYSRTDASLVFTDLADAVTMYLGPKG